MTFWDRKQRGDNKIAAPRDSNDSSTDYDTERVTSISKGCFDNLYWSFALSYNHSSEEVKLVPEGSENEEINLCKVGSTLQCSWSISHIYNALSYTCQNCLKTLLLCHGLLIKLLLCSWPLQSSKEGVGVGWWPVLTGTCAAPWCHPQAFLGPSQGLIKGLWLPSLLQALLEGSLDQCHCHEHLEVCSLLSVQWWGSVAILLDNPFPRAQQGREGTPEPMRTGSAGMALATTAHFNTWGV